MLKLGTTIGDRIDLIESGERVTITLDQTRKHAARLIVRDDVGNGVTAWLELGDCVHLDGFFSGPVNVRLDKPTKRGAKLIFDAPSCVRFERVKTSQQFQEDPS